jgi:uracil-DNA glycosylase
MDKFAWADFELQVLECNNCPLAKTRHNVVFGGGSINAKVFIIGEGPGADEDLSGIPFVGKSGQLLDKILEACAFTRKEHVYIGNIVKCRPPGNRNPNPDEISACLPYLHKQIEMINPKIIILLGRVALQTMIAPNAKITQFRGKWIEWNGRFVMPTYHPSALLRNPALKKDTWEDFQNVFHKYRELINPNHKSNHIKSSE